MTAPSRLDTAWTAAGFGMQLAGQAGRAVILALLLSPEDLGRFFILRSAAGVAAFVAQLGLGTVGLRRLAAARGDGAVQKGIVGGVVRVTAVSTASVAALGAAAALMFGLGIGEATLAAMMIGTQAMSGILSELGRGLGRVRTMAAIDRALAPALEVAALTAMFLLTRSTSFRDVLLLLTVAGAIPLALLARELRRAVPGVDDGAGAPHVRTLLFESWPVTVNGLLWRALAEADLWIVGALAGVQAAAIYGVGMRLAAPLQASLGVAVYVLAGPISGLYAAGAHAELQHLLRRTARWTAIVSATGFMLIAAMGERGLAAVFGPIYADALPVFLVLGIAQLVNVAAGLGGTTLLMIGRTRALMLISLASSLVTLVLAAALLPVMGLMGAAVASLTGMVLQNTLMVMAVHRYAGIRVDAGWSHA
jgi:O-antigen/teichoic acid export membrane protein